MKIRPQLNRSAIAFTLLEVIIACAIFFMCAFAILELVTRGLSAARSIQQREPHIGLVFSQFATNKTFEAGTFSGDFEENFPGVYPGYQWTCEIIPLCETNELYELLAVITGRTGNRKTTEITGRTVMWGSQPRTGAGRFPAGSGGRR